MQKCAAPLAGHNVVRRSEIYESAGAGAAAASSSAFAVAGSSAAFAAAAASPAAFAADAERMTVFFFLSCERTRLEHDAELKLAKQLLKFPEVLKRLEGELYPNQLCDYLFETSQKFNQFYENCPVLGAETDELRASRTALCTATAQLLRLSLGLLGIGVLDRL